MKFKRIFLIILDSLGVGEAVDSDEYNSKGANTLGHIMDNTDIFIPNLAKMGLLSSLKMNNEESEAYYTIARPKNKGNDCIVSHYELMGINQTTAFNNFNYGPFPRELLEKIAATIKKPIIGNIISDPQNAITRLYKRQMETKSLIIYTTGDSNLEVAAEEEVISINELYDCCEKIREITKNEKYKIASIVARPFIYKNNNVSFTDDIKIFTLNPASKSVLDALKSNNLQTISIGKINDLFNGNGISKIIKSSTNSEAINKLLDIMDKNFDGLCLVNLSDFDDKYGSARNVIGFKNSLEEFDVELPLILNKLNIDDLLIITSDHGNDPTYEGYFHTRENVPVLIYSRCLLESGQLDILNTLGDIGATIADNFNVEKPWLGESFLNKLK